MADFNPDTSFINEIDPSGRLKNLFDNFLASHNRTSAQSNTAPTGAPTPPPQISALSVQANSAGFHSIQITDSTPVNRGIVYHVEWSPTPDFTNAQPVVSNTPYRNANHFMGAAGAYYRAFSSYGDGPPSDPVYFGPQSQPTLVQSSGVISGGSIAGPTPLPSTGSGTEPSLFPQSAAGFGFEPTRPQPLPPV